jgi:prefoldin subunit 5
MNDLASLRVKEEIIAFDEYVSSVKGVYKLHFESLMIQYGQSLEKLGEQRRLEKEYVHEIASLKESLEGEEDEQATLEEKFDSIEETNNEVIDKLIKERDHACAKVKVLKKEKVEFGVGHDKLVKDLEDLDKAHKALESEHSILTKSREQLQNQLTKNGEPSSSTSSCNHANIIEENTKLKDEFAKSTIPIGEKNLNDLLSNQRSNNVKPDLAMSPRKRRRTTTRRKQRPSPHKQIRIPLWVVMPQGAEPLMMTLREMLTLTMSYFVIIMVMCMQNMLAHMMNILLGLFGSQRPLLLTEEDPLRNGT